MELVQIGMGRKEVPEFIPNNELVHCFIDNPFAVWVQSVWRGVALRYQAALHGRPSYCKCHYDDVHYSYDSLFVVTIQSDRKPSSH